MPGASRGAGEPAPDHPQSEDLRVANQVARWQMGNGTVTREQLAMVSVLMSRQAARHPGALTRRAHTLREVLDAPAVAPATGRLECVYD